MSYGAGGWELADSHRRLRDRYNREEKKGRAARRTQLQSFARRQFQLPNRCQSLVNIVAKAAELVETVPGYQSLRATAMIDDLASVLIGTGMREGRGSGPHFAGNVSGASGFKINLRDDWNQTQHAIAGLVIGYRHGKLGEWFVRWVEEEPQDDRLYKATCPIGRELAWSPRDYKKVAEKLRKAIGDASCQMPSPKG